MKKNYICLFLFLLFFCFFNVAFASEKKLQNIVILDPGHGGVDPGTVIDDIKEKDINLKIALKVKEKLEQKNITVLLTRDGDYDLASPEVNRRKKSDFDHRIRRINESGANYYISIHLNYLENKSYFGPQVFYTTENKDLAIQMQNDCNKILNVNREAKKIPNTIYMYSKLKVPGVLIECGFLSNDEERKKLLDDNYIDNLASIIANNLKF